MKLKAFKDIIDKAYEYAGHTAEHVNIEVSFKKTIYEIRQVSQMNVVPTVYIEIGEKVFIDE